MVKQRKSDDEIRAEVGSLRELKPKIRRFTAFGDDNWKQLDAQIETLSRGMDEDEVNDRFENSDENSSAYEALAWASGESDELPSDGWRELVRK